MKQVVFGIILGLLLPVVAVLVWINMGTKSIENGVPGIPSTPEGALGQKLVTPSPQGKTQIEKWIQVRGQMIIPQPLQKTFDPRNSKIRMAIYPQFAKITEGLVAGVDDLTILPNGRFDFRVFDKDDVLLGFAKANSIVQLQLLVCKTDKRYCDRSLTPNFRAKTIFKIEQDTMTKKGFDVGRLVISEYIEAVSKCKSSESTFRTNIHATESFRKKYLTDANTVFLMVYPGFPTQVSGNLPLKVIPLEFKGADASVVVPRFAESQSAKHYWNFIAACFPKETKTDCEKRLTALPFGSEHMNLQDDKLRMVKLLPDGLKAVNCGTDTPFKLWAPWFEHDTSLFPYKINSGGLPEYVADGIFY